MSEVVVSEVVKKYVIFGGGRLMQYEILLRDGSKLRIGDYSVHHISADGINLYSYDCSKSSTIPSEEKKEMVNSYFFLIGEEERREIAAWLKTVTPETIKQERFVSRVEFALYRVPQNFKIATIEPSLSDEGRIFYKPKSRVGRGISYVSWDVEANNFYFDDEWSSSLASPEEGDLFTAYRVATGKWSLAYICDDSSGDGNYWDAPSSKRNFEPSGARQVGGFSDGVGNTLKIFKDASTFIVFGGDYIKCGATQPVASINSIVYDPFAINYRACGVVVLRKN